MKTISNLLAFILFLTLYSCGSGEKHKEVDNDIQAEKQTAIKPGNDGCDFSTMQIGENSNTQSPVELIGLFENLNNTGEHTYGYTISLWKLDAEILGFFNRYEGSLEPNRSGPIIKGKLNNGNLHFKVWTKQGKSYKDWQQSDVHIYSFTGQKKNTKITGHFSMHDCSNKASFNDFDEQVELLHSDMWELKSYKNLKDWKQNHDYKLDQEE